ncbi:MAG: PfkB family carbohydrate kinase [Magnetococcus sp. DMHC-6]
MDAKIILFEQLLHKAEELRHFGNKIVLCHGVFDLLHLGNMRHLAQARKLGDCLLVTITADRFLSEGLNRSLFPESMRAESLASLEVVDYVSILPDPNVIPALLALKPHLYVKPSLTRVPNSAAENILSQEKEAMDSFNGEIVYTDEITFNARDLLNDHFGLFSPQTREYLNRFSANYSLGALLESIRSLQNISVLVVGESIIEEYYHVQNMDFTGSGGTLATRLLSIEPFVGGALAIANHLSGFSRQVSLLSGIGRDSSQEAFIRSNLSPKITPYLFYFEQAPTLMKRRFVDPELKTLFEMYDYNPNPMTREVERNICAQIEKIAARFDLVLVADYGYGFISPYMVDLLCQNVHFLAVNTQANAGNRGCHAITRYPRADFIALNESELRLAVHDAISPLEEVAARVAARVRATNLVVTLREQGAMLLECHSHRHHYIPAFSTQVVDRTGAGDAFLSLSALSLAGGISQDLAVFIGSAAAALMVQTVGNRLPSTEENFLHYLTHLLK